MPFLTFSIFSSLKGSPTMGNILSVSVCRYRGGTPSDPRGCTYPLRGTCLCLPPNRLATLSTEADLQLAYCSTSTPVPLRARGRQERISARKQEHFWGAGGNAVNNPTDLNHYRQSLLAKQQELLTANGGRLVLGPAGGLEVADVMDQALAESEAKIDAHLSQARSRLRQAIEEALLRLKKGNYGCCTACGNPISKTRLKAIPWTHLCRDCVEQEEARF